MILPASPLLPSSLPPVAPASGARAPSATPSPVSAAGRSSGIALDFSGWRQPALSPTVRGDLPYPGNPADASAVADAIAGLLFDRG